MHDALLSAVAQNNTASDELMAQAENAKRDGLRKEARRLRDEAWTCLQLNLPLLRQLPPVWVKA